MLYTIPEIAKIINAEMRSGSYAAGSIPSIKIDHLLTDSRKIVLPKSSLFFALKSSRRSGEDFIAEVYERRVRHFVVERDFDCSPFPEAIFLLVDNVLEALQDLAGHHRACFDYPVIGITGSNGKTIVKEWLNELLEDDYKIVRSPRSYNSQIGVPLSVWEMNHHHTLAIFEAGISTVNEMATLQSVIRPGIGILTNIGSAHDEGFKDTKEKLKEKIKLFSEAEYVVAEYGLIPKDALKAKQLTWSFINEGADLFIAGIEKHAAKTTLEIRYQQHPFKLTIPFTDSASISNAVTCITLMLLLGIDFATIESRLQLLKGVEMRLQLKTGVNNCFLINDSYSNDISSLSIALDYLKQQSGKNKTTVILSDIFQSGVDDMALYKQVAEALAERGIDRLVAVGKHINKALYLFQAAVAKVELYSSTENFLRQTTTHHFKDEYILLKGARVFEFERIANKLSQKVHQTVLEINLSALVKNLKIYQQHLLPSTKLMAMVKAYGYGSGSAEVARVLQYHKVDYLAVAYADEGVELRKAGISLPIMVMNADEEAFDAMVENNLEPEIYSFNIYNAFHAYLVRQGIKQHPIHIKINTGMNRLGFEHLDAVELGKLLIERKTMVVQSAFSHLAASEDDGMDEFTAHQTYLFDGFCGTLKNIIGYGFIKHVANSAAIFRHPGYQYNMVRLGIGLYGVDSASLPGIRLENVASLKTTIAQIRTISAGETVGYNRRGTVERTSRIATIRIGYADGYSRRMGNGVGFVYVRNRRVPVIGNVCMDMTMIDVTDIPNIAEGDVVEVFGPNIPVEEIALECNTIAYEILTGISQRVKRVYIEE